MRTNKNINPLRKDFFFSDGRKDMNDYSFSAIKGYATPDGTHVGPAIIYKANSKLDSIGSYDLNPDSQGIRKNGHWKYFDDKNNIYKEELIIK